MTTGSIQFHPAAADEVDAATHWYRQRSRRAAEAFLDELERTVTRISQNPRQFSAYDSETRRAVFTRFPYLIVFREAASGIEVIAVAHGHRRPGYWRDRLE